jgi:hypothetical protein
MKQRTRKKGLSRRVRSPLRRGIIAAGVAMIVFPEPVTTAIGTAMVGACLAVPEHQPTMKLTYSGASIRRGHLDTYGRSYA